MRQQGAHRDDLDPREEGGKGGKGGKTSPQPFAEEYCLGRWTHGSRHHHWIGSVKELGQREGEQGDQRQKNEKSEVYEVNTLLILGTNQGHLLTKKLTFKSPGQTGPGPGPGPSSLSISSFCELIKVDAPISDVVISSEPSANGIDFLIVVVEGVRVSAVLLEVSGSGSELSCRKFHASPPCHGVPIVSACCDTAGVFANVAQLGSSFVERANILTMDSMGHGVIWRLLEGARCRLHSGSIQ